MATSGDERINAEKVQNLGAFIGYESLEDRQFIEM